MIEKTKFEEYTESEFLEFLMRFFRPEDHETEDTDESLEAYEKQMDRWVYHFENITEHPSGSDLLFYPEKGEGSPEAIIDKVKTWRAANGKPSFKGA